MLLHKNAPQILRPSQVLEEVEKFRTEVARQSEIIATAEAQTNDAKRNCDEFKVVLKKVENEWNAYIKDNKRLDDVIRNFDAGIKRLEDEQQGLQTMVSKKYQVMWVEVEKALTEMSDRHIKDLQKELGKKSSANVGCYSPSPSLGGEGWMWM